ncbi:MFS transporter [Chloroflexota bacterium]
MKRIHHSWIQVVLGALALNTLAIRIYTFGVFLVPIATEFGWGRGVLSGASSVAALVGAVTNIIGGRLSDKYGPRFLVTTSGLAMIMGYILLSQIGSLWQVYLIMGLFMPIGVSGCFFPVMSTISRWFHKKRVTAIGIAMTGFALGAVIWPPITQWLISSYNWRFTFVALALITAVVSIPVAQFMRHSPQRVGLLPYGESIASGGEKGSSLADMGLSPREAINTRHFWLWGPILLCFFFCLDLIMTHIVAYALDVGIPAIIAAFTLSIIAAVSIIGRLSGGSVSDWMGIRKLVSGSLVLVILALISLLVKPGIWSFITFALIFGLGYGFFIILESAMSAELFGTKSLGAIMATLGIFGMTGTAAGRTLGGVIFDLTGSYQDAFLLCIILVVTALILSVILIRSGIPAVKPRQIQLISR